MAQNSVTHPASECKKPHSARARKGKKGTPGQAPVYKFQKLFYVEGDSTGRIYQAALMLEQLPNGKLAFGELRTSSAINAKRPSFEVFDAGDEDVRPTLDCIFSDVLKMLPKATA
jgi:hypothetical protein